MIREGGLPLVSVFDRAAKQSPSTPSAAVTPFAPSPVPGDSAKPATPQPPSAKPSVPTTSSVAITPATQSPGGDMRSPQRRQRKCPPENQQNHYRYRRQPSPSRPRRCNLLE